MAGDKYTVDSRALLFTVQAYQMYYLTYIYAVGMIIDVQLSPQCRSLFRYIPHISFSKEILGVCLVSKVGSSKVE